MERRRERIGKSAIVIVVVVIMVVAVVGVSSAAIMLTSPKAPKLTVDVNVVNFYNESALPSRSGYVLIQLTIDVTNSEGIGVPLDPCDFVLDVETSQHIHFAWRVGNLTSISSVFNGLINTSNQGRVLPPNASASLWIPFEIPIPHTLYTITWKTSLGDVTSNVQGSVNDRLQEFYDTMH